jgi:hypothetical protein
VRYHEKTTDIPISTDVYGNLCGEMIRNLPAETSVKMRTILKELYQKTFMTPNIDLESRVVKILVRADIKKVQVILTVTAHSS